MLSPVKANEPLCRLCRHSYITYETGMPYGCKAFGFKSARICSLVVFESTGQDCSGFDPRPDTKPPQGKKR
jgi:hypothetical protein